MAHIDHSDQNEGIGRVRNDQQPLHKRLTVGHHSTGSAPPSEHLADGNFFAVKGGAKKTQKETTIEVTAVFEADSKRKKILHTLEIAGYFGLWYVLNIAYNIVNKKVLNKFQVPWTMATVQLGIGGLYAFLGWASHLRSRPVLSLDNIRNISPVAFYHGSGQLLTVISLFAGAVSFAHIVKALEPFFSAVISAVFLKSYFKPQVYATLIPVVAGVAMACYSEIDFKWLAFGAAMGSNLCFACRANFSKVLMTKPQGKNMDAANLYAVVTIIAFLMLVPFALAAEAGILSEKWQEALATGVQEKKLLTNIVLSGLFHYLNNEVMYLALKNVHPITLAVGNTMKRVFIIVASLIVFRNPITKTGAIGSAIGIAGVLVYALTKQYYENLAKKSSGNQ